MSFKIKFENRMRKSYKVSSNISYKNERGLHVETPIEELTGKEFELGKRTQKQIGNNVTVMYDVVDLTNGNHPAHITVYFGPEEDADKY